MNKTIQETHPSLFVRVGGDSYDKDWFKYASSYDYEIIPTSNFEDVEFFDLNGVQKYTRDVQEITKVIDTRIASAKRLQEQYPHLQLPDGTFLPVRILEEVKNALRLDEVNNDAKKD